MQTIFKFDRGNYMQCQNTYRGSGNLEWYLGDYSIEAGSVIDVCADRRAVGAFSIICVRSRTRMTFRRSWSHIRQDGIDVSVLWFVRRGSLSIDHQSGKSVARVGDFALTKSTTPFFIECQTDEHSMYEVLQVVVPTFVQRRLFPQNLNTGFCMSMEGREFAIAERLLKDIYEDADEISDPIAQQLVEDALLLLSEAVTKRGVRGEVRQSLSDKRLQDVLRFIDVHLSSPELSIAMVAKGCGISIRYLFHLIKSHGMSFSSLVWNKRLKIAKQWLLSSKPSEVPIREIAYRVGFKSAAHFSRMFKNTYAISPCQCRASGNPKRPDPPKLLVPRSARALQ
jgi:AraC-like DNA-binding protein